MNVTWYVLAGRAIQSTRPSYSQCINWIAQRGGRIMRKTRHAPGDYTVVTQVATGYRNGRLTNAELRYWHVVRKEHLQEAL